MTTTMRPLNSSRQVQSPNCLVYSAARLMGDPTRKNDLVIVDPTSSFTVDDFRLGTVTHTRHLLDRTPWMGTDYGALLLRLFYQEDTDPWQLDTYPNPHLIFLENVSPTFIDELWLLHSIAHNETHPANPTENPWPGRA